MELDFFKNINIAIANDIGNRMIFFARYINNDMIPVYFASGGDNVYKAFQGQLTNEKVDIESSGLSKREWNELMTSFGFSEKLV